MAFKNDRSIHLATERHRLLGLAETAALDGDSNTAYTLISIAEAVSKLPSDGNGVFHTRKEETNA